MTNFVNQITNFGLQSCFIAREEIMLFVLIKFYCLITVIYNLKKLQTIYGTCIAKWTCKHDRRIQIQARFTADEKGGGKKKARRHPVKFSFNDRP